MNIPAILKVRVIYFVYEMLCSLEWGEGLVSHKLALFFIFVQAF